MGSIKGDPTSKYLNFLFKHTQEHIFKGVDIWVVSQHTSLLGSPDQWGEEGVSSRDESKFGNLTGIYHGVLVIFH